MSKEEFSKIMVMIKAAYPNSNLVPDEMSKNFWYEKLKAMEYSILSGLLYRYVEKVRYIPSIAEIYEMYYGQAYALWTREWIKLLNGAKSSELNMPGQYALKIITRNHFEYCMDNPHMLTKCMKEFERHYREFVLMDERERKQFIELNMFQMPVTEIEGGEKNESVSSFVRGD